MRIEHALLSVKPSEQPEFEKAFPEAQQVIAKAPGFQFIDLLRDVKGGTYLLIVAWANDEAGANEFHASELYEQWTALLDPFLAQPQDSSLFELLSHYPG
ncbi:Heme-degrading monooxygenase HmoA [Streptomyces sp. DvalAA-14]|uniref:antibiotic biosynthesis monooxygenase family protein n=1 Tax=unclassified Streptomyces TaxID=2593676 RepID=UPI00081AFEE1|nr:MULTISPECIES: antibiotic biosynthesis monooxygenase family protein [unclassified Streptomyces]MYS24413.1 antibiotic biosynthesis monooxygenase [Streptomyces sp. SID4948]SCE45802.1 Heme-degrading monooxygenase HmoA [Streptomyces sp. DvalAA-14]